jgi:hypothetical protein
MISHLTRLPEVAPLVRRHKRDGFFERELYEGRCRRLHLDL